MEEDWTSLGASPDQPFAHLFNHVGLCRESLLAILHKSLDGIGPSTCVESVDLTRSLLGDQASVTVGRGREISPTKHTPVGDSEPRRRRSSWAVHTARDITV